MSSKAIIFLGLAFAVVLLIASEVTAARDLAEASTTEANSDVAEQTNGVNIDGNGFGFSGGTGGITRGGTGGGGHGVEQTNGVNDAKSGGVGIGGRSGMNFGHRGQNGGGGHGVEAMPQN